MLLFFCVVILRCCRSYHYDEERPKENFPIGDAVVRVDTVGLTGTPATMNFKLVNPNDGQADGEVSFIYRSSIL